MRTVTPLALAILLLPAGAASAATIVVNDGTDTLHSPGCATTGTGTCSLRDAITFSNTNGGPDVINFGLAGTGLHTLQPSSPLPVISDAVTIDGTTQSGAAVNTNPTGQGLNTVIGIEIDGTNAGTFGLKVAASNTTIRGLAINRVGSYDIWLSNGAFTGNKVEGCFIGTNATGTGFFAGKDFWGIQIDAGTNFTIGGLTPDKRNLIGGNIRGIEIGDSANTGHLIQGNLMGTTASGTAKLNASSSTFGISLRVVTGLTIGGTAPGAANVISGMGAGILIGNSLGQTTAGGNFIYGNFIGTDVTGTVALGNASYGVGAYNINSTIGGGAAGQGNVIGGTTFGPGIAIQGGTGTIVQGNFIGTDTTATIDLGNKQMGIDVEASNCVIGGVNAGEGNVIFFSGGSGPFPAGVGVVGGNLNTRIEGNRIYKSRRTTVTNGLGIDLGNDGVTPNDPCDADAGFQNYPVLTTGSSVAGSTNIQGTLNSTASTSYRIEFFSNAFCDPTGYGEGQNYLGFTNTTTDGACNATFNATFPVSVTTNYVITATATNLTTNETSEFSKCLTLPSKFHTLTPCRVVDTRNPNGPYGGPALVANTDRSFVFTGQCGVPATASGVALNVAVTAPTAQGDLRLLPTGAALPLVSAINYNANQTRANNAVIVLGPNGDLTVHMDQASGTVHVILDVDGYFE